MKSWIEPIKGLGACREALEWAKSYKSLNQAWAKCERGDWMLWLLGNLSGESGSDSRKKLVLVACQCARLSLPYVTKGEKRPLEAIETAEAWARGDNGTTLQDVRDAAYAANAAAYAANAAYAAYAANAAYAAYAANAANAAAYAANAETLRKCADIVRENYSAPKSKEEV